jgi:cytochrome c553
MPQVYPYAILVVVLLGCSAKKDQVEAPQQQPVSESYSGNAANGKALYTTCAACHGNEAQGNVKMKGPALANADTWYLHRQLVNFRQDIRGSSLADTLGFQMAAMAKSLKDSIAVADVVAYIKSFQEVSLATSITGDIKKGERAYQSVCGSCHGSGAKGNEMMNAPRLNGIDDWYLKRQLNNFKNSVRGSHPDDKLGAQMVPMATLLNSEEDINNVIAYIRSTAQPVK